jgi:hypothetical protein
VKEDFYRVFNIFFLFAIEVTKNILSFFLIFATEFLLKAALAQPFSITIFWNFVEERRSYLVRRFVRRPLRG